MTDKESTEMEELLAKQFKEYWDGMRSFYGKIKLCDMKFRSCRKSGFWLGLQERIHDAVVKKQKEVQMKCYECNTKNVWMRYQK